MHNFQPSRQSRNHVLDPTSTSPFDHEARAKITEILEDDAVNPGESGYHIYSRYGNPTIREAEAMLAEIEGPDIWCTLLLSGMSAIHCCLALFDEEAKNDREANKALRSLLFPKELYGGTRLYLKKVLEPRGIKCEFVELTQIPTSEADDATTLLVKRLNDQSQPIPRAVLVESITNPSLWVFDLKKVIDVAHERGIVVIIDNTFATPALCRPLD